jgi:hypothetical protein
MLCGRCCVTEPPTKLALRLDIFIEILPRTRVNKGRRKGRGEIPQPFLLLWPATIVQDPLVGSQSSLGPSLSLGPSSSACWPTTL